MLTRWEPYRTLRRRRRGDVFGELSSMQQELNRLFEDFFGSRSSQMAEGTWFPAVDVSENDSEITIQAELPGLTQDDIDINLEDHRLTLSGEKKEENDNYHSIERSCEKFSRSFTLLSEIDAEHVQANFKDGVLKMTLPKTKESKPKKISITAGS